MKILFDKEIKEIERIKKQNEFLVSGCKAISTCINYQKAIIAILEQVGIQKIEIPMSYLNEYEKELLVTENNLDNTIQIKIKQR